MNEKQYEHLKSYTCECGRAFDNPQAYNGHCSHCSLHLTAVGKPQVASESLANIRRASKIGVIASQKYRKEEKEMSIIEWLSEKHTCEKCGKIMTERYGSGRFCSKSCANARKHSDETKNKITESLIKTAHLKSENNTDKRSENILKYNDNPNKCSICGNVLDYDHRNNVACSDECYHVVRCRCGTLSANTRVVRSKNEIEFCRLCEENFCDVEHNEIKFFGWDADVIINDIRVAVLWNGIWHYRKIKSNQSMKQIEKRDEIKINKIIEFGYTPVIIKDLGKENKEFVKNKFDEFMNIISSNFNNHDVIEL